MAHHSRRFGLACCLAVTSFVTLAFAAFAQTGGPYDLSWHNIGPGGSAGGGSYDLLGSIGQPDAATMSGGSYTLTGGFLPGGPACALVGDLDGQVTVLDIQMIAAAWPQATASFPYDQSGDGDLDIQDVILVAAQFGNVC